VWDDKLFCAWTCESAVAGCNIKWLPMQAISTRLSGAFLRFTWHHVLFAVQQC
jgi:hypothetical protein